jgi:dTDP-glucose pyrophosphorylase
MNIVVPMAGRGARFAERGVQTPKPLISVLGRPMVAWALQSLQGVACQRLIFVTLREHEQHFQVTSLLRDLVSSPIEVVILDNVTEGQVCTVLAARQWIDSDDDLLIASADTYVVSNLGEDIARRKPETAGLISVADLPGERWSFARTDADGQVVEVAEKVRISNHASTGLYYFSSGRQFVAVADAMIRNQEKTRGEYYVIPVYQKYIQNGWQVGLSAAQEVWDMGNPEALAEFERFQKG